MIRETFEFYLNYYLTYSPANGNLGTVPVAAGNNDGFQGTPGMTNGKKLMSIYTSMFTEI